MTSNRSLVRIAAIVAALVVLAGCGGGENQLSDAGVRQNDADRIPSDVAPEELADKEIPTECANDLGTGDPVFEAAFCAYREAALAATSGPDGVAGIDPSLLSAGDDAAALFPSDPAAALATLEAATATLTG